IRTAAALQSIPRAGGQPIREECHGQGSDAQQQGEEEAEGRVEQEEEGGPQPLAVRPGAGANPARAEPVREEELAAPSAPTVTPRQSSSPPQNGGYRSSTSGGSHRRPRCPMASIPCACRARTARDRAEGCTPR